MSNTYIKPRTLAGLEPLTFLCGDFRDAQCAKPSLQNSNKNYGINCPPKKPSRLNFSNKCLPSQRLFSRDLMHTIQTDGTRHLLKHLENKFYFSIVRKHLSRAICLKIHRVQ
jgi:hypothetical protein